MPEILVEVFLENSDFGLANLNKLHQVLRYDLPLLGKAELQGNTCLYNRRSVF